MRNGFRRINYGGERKVRHDTHSRQREFRQDINHISSVIGTVTSIVRNGNHSRGFAESDDERINGKGIEFVLKKGNGLPRKGHTLWLTNLNNGDKHWRAKKFKMIM